MSFPDNSLVTGLPESFALACGMSGPLEVFATHRSTGATRSVRFDRPFAFVGRARSMGVLLDDPSVSQCHAYLQVVGGVPYCIDLGSRTGVVWDDGRQGRGWVYPGQTLRVGMFDVRVGNPEAMVEPPGPLGGHEHSPVLEVYAPSGGPAGRHPLDQPVTLVGRHPNCDLRLPDDAAPYFQCALVGTPDGVWCIDIWSQKGTRLNARSVRLARVHDGDLIEIGRTSLVLRTGLGSGRPLALSESAGAPEAEALAAIPKQVTEVVAGVFASFREVLEQYQQCLTTTAQTFATMQQEHAAMMCEQMRQAQELTRELRELRADAERESAAARSLAATQQEHASRVCDQLRQVQELTRELWADVQRERATPQTRNVPAAVEPVPLTAAKPEPTPVPPTITEAPRPTPKVAPVRQAQTLTDVQAWSLGRPATTVHPQVGNSVRAEPVRPAGPARAVQETEILATEAAARQAQAERIAGQSAEWRQAEIEMGNQILASVLTERTTKLGPDHPDTLATMNDLALGYRDAGQREKALPLLEQALRLRRAKLGPDHPDTLATMHNLASVYRAAGKLDQSLTLCEEAIERATAKLGPDHPDTLSTVGNLAAAYLGAKQIDKALALFGRYVSGMRGQLGADTPRFAGLLTLVSHDLLAARQYTVAEQYLRECLSVLERKQLDAWVTHHAKSLLGGSLLGQKKYADAEPLLLAGYQGMKRMESTVPPEVKVQLREAAHRLVELYTASGNAEAATRWRTEGADPAGAAPAARKEAAPA